MREMRWESTIATDTAVKTSGIYVISTDGIEIANVSVRDINSENQASKVSSISDTNKNSTVSYPSVKAVAEYAASKNDVSDISDKLPVVSATQPDKTNILWVDTSSTATGPAVRWDVEQTLTDAQKTQARENIGIGIATVNKPGLILGGASLGIYVSSNSGQLSVTRAADAAIDAKREGYQPIVPLTIDRAVRAGLLSNAQITDDDKPAICRTIGAAYDGGFEEVASLELNEDTGVITIETPACHSILMSVIIPIQTRNNNGVESQIIINYDPNSGASKFFKMTTAFSTDYATYNVFYVHPVNGRFFADYATALNSYTNRLGISDRYPVNLGRHEYEPITNLRYAASNFTFPARTQVIILGVKA